MQNIEIEALKYLSKDIEFCLSWRQLRKILQGFVDAVVIESQGDHKVCIKFDENNSDFFEVDQMFKIKVFYKLWKPCCVRVTWVFVNIPRDLLFRLNSSVF